MEHAHQLYCEFIKRFSFLFQSNLLPFPVCKITKEIPSNWVSFIYGQFHRWKVKIKSQEKIIIWNYPGTDGTTSIDFRKRAVSFRVDRRSMRNFYWRNLTCPKLGRLLSHDSKRNQIGGGIGIGMFEIRAANALIRFGVSMGKSVYPRWKT